jgi:hypothetical protein
MNKHLKCAIKFPITVALIAPFLVFVFLPIMVVAGLLAISGCSDKWINDPPPFKVFDWWSQL